MLQLVRSTGGARGMGKVFTEDFIKKLANWDKSSLMRLLQEALEETGHP